ncbi:MAG: M28 family peptidase [Ferruginibacter sp.]
MRLLKRLLLTIAAIIIILFIWGKIYSIETPLVQRAIAADTTRISTDLRFLTKECVFRNYRHMNELNKAAGYIKNEFIKITGNADSQLYHVNDFEFKNVLCTIGPKDAKRIVIGAHYDVCSDQEGADDNASGVAGMLELLRLLKKEQLKYRIDFVAYSTEEPPFFGTQNMGSYIHAKSLHDAGTKVKGMISLEMIGVYYDEPGTQHYPAFFLDWFYGNKGNFITVVQKFSNGEFGDYIRKRMKEEPVIPTKSFTGPAWIPGVDFSDHKNYWKFGYSALMITNTAFYRNKNYHTADDTYEKIDVNKMAMVVDELFHTLKDIQ